MAADRLVASDVTGADRLVASAGRASLVVVEAAQWALRVLKYSQEGVHAFAIYSKAFLAWSVRDPFDYNAYTAKL